MVILFWSSWGTDCVGLVGIHSIVETKQNQEETEYLDPHPNFTTYQLRDPGPEFAHW